QTPDLSGELHLIDPRTDQPPKSWVVAVCSPLRESAFRIIVLPEQCVQLPMDRRNRQIVLIDQPQNLSVDLSLLGNCHSSNNLTCETPLSNCLQVTDHFSVRSFSTVMVGSCFVAVE